MPQSILNPAWPKDGTNSFCDQTTFYHPACSGAKRARSKEDWVCSRQRTVWNENGFTFPVRPFAEFGKNVRTWRDHVDRRVAIKLIVTSCVPCVIMILYDNLILQLNFVADLFSFAFCWKGRDTYTIEDLIVLSLCLNFNGSQDNSFVE